MAKYFDHRERREKSIPDCGKHGLVWNSRSQRCEQITGLGYVDEFNTDLYLNGGSGDYGFYELPYYEPVYYQEPVYQEPVYQEPVPVYYELPPPPEPIPEPAYIAPEPVYEPVYDVALYREPVSYYEAQEPIYFELPYVEPEPIVYAAPEPVYIEPEPIVEEFFALPLPPIEPEPEPIVETVEETFFALPVPPEPEPEPEPVITPTLPGYVGCFADASDRDLPHYAQAGGSLTIESCKSLCAAAGYQYAGAQYSGHCFCGNAYGSYGASGNCNMPCSGNPDQICGGSWASSVYALPVAQEPELVAPASIAEPEPFIGPTPEPVSVIGEKPMAEDFYIDDYYGGDFYDGGYSYAGDVSYLADGGGGGFDDYYFYEPIYEPIDYAPEFEFFEPEPLPDLPIFEQEPFFPELPIETFPIFEPLPDLPVFDQEEFFWELPFTPLPEIGFLEPLPPIELGPIETIQIETEPGLLPTEQPVILPELAPSPFVPAPIEPLPFDFFELPFVPLPEPPPAPAPAPLGPCNTETGLPGACPQGQYHPQYDPCACIPFPPAPAPAPAPKPPTTAPSPAPKPPTQQAPQQQAQPCPTGYCKHPTTGQCMPIPAGYARHPQTQVCVLATQQQATTEPDVLASIKELPWWVWAALAGVVVLTGGRR